MEIAEKLEALLPWKVSNIFIYIYIYIYNSDSQLKIRITKNRTNLTLKNLRLFLIATTSKQKQFILISNQMALVAPTYLFARGNSFHIIHTSFSPSSFFLFI